MGVRSRTSAPVGVRSRRNGDARHDVSHGGGPHLRRRRRDQPGADHRGDPDALLQPGEGQRTDVPPRLGGRAGGRQRRGLRRGRRGLGRLRVRRHLLVAAPVRRGLPVPRRPHVAQATGTGSRARAPDVDGRHRCLLTGEGTGRRSAAGRGQPEEPAPVGRRRRGARRARPRYHRRGGRADRLRGPRQPDHRRPRRLPPRRRRHRQGPARRGQGLARAPQRRRDDGPLPRLRREAHLPGHPHP
jgi:hypothetical protein